MASPMKAHPNTGFAWLRMIGALIVVVDHSMPLTDPSRLTLFPTSWALSPGYIALLGFFAMSGYQISDSWKQDPSWWRFSAKRVLRLWPPLLCVVLVTTLVIGPLVSTLAPGDYFSAQQTWGYIVNNAGLYTLQHRLPGVFADNPWPWSVNGSIWTLPMEFTGYLLVLTFGALALFRRAPWLTIVLMLALVALDRRFEASIGNPGDGGSFLQVPIGSMVAFLVPFSIGMVLHAYRGRIPLSPAVAWSLVGLQIAVHTTKAGALTLPFMAGYGAIVLAFHWPARLEGYDSWVFGSYGLYVWAFPMQQLLIMAGVDALVPLIVTAVPLSYLCGWLSWRYIEQPTLSLRRYLRRRKLHPVAASRLRRLSQPARPSPPEREPSVPAPSA
ncbi:MAG: acyltransferase [Actinomycetota bacterium]|nr:acyltransferase [Actinomycetota bacterium]